MKKTLTLLLLALTLLTGCLENVTTKSFGGTMKVDLPEGQRLMEATWKGDELWYLTRERNEDEGESPRTYTFQEKSTFGAMEGKVVFVEH